jgi:dipeptidyl aminopeptidase/acylaminoacyl peptidase
VWLFALGVGCTDDSGRAVTQSTPQVTAAERALDQEPSPPAQADAPGQPRAASGYEIPPKSVLDIVDAPPTPSVWSSPDGKYLVHATYDALPSIEVVARPFERLAGMRIDPRRNAARRTRLYRSLTVQDVSTGMKTAVQLELEQGDDALELGPPVWSPSGGLLAFTRATSTGLELWVANVVTGTAGRLGSDYVNDTLGPGFRWMPASTSLLVWWKRSDAGEPPAAPTTPDGPVVKDTQGREATNRTYQDLLKNAHDERLFEHFVTAQLAVVSVDEGTSMPVGAPAMITDARSSPDGKYVLVERLRRPFSYTVPHWRFARVIEVLDRGSRVVRVVADQDAADAVPIDGVRKGARDVHWQPTAPATLVWAEALDEGDPRKTVEHRDRVMTHAAPFADVPVERWRVEHRLSAIDWLSQNGQALVREYDRDRRWTTTWLVDLVEGSIEPKKIFDRSVRDAYGDPGQPVRMVRPDGHIVVGVDDGAIHLTGAGATPDGNRPFLDRLRLDDGATERLFHSAPDRHEQFVHFVGDERDRFIVRREAPDEPPDYFVHGVDEQRRLTEFPHPHPQLSGMKKRLLKYRRRDGVPLSGTLYLPPGHVEGERIPLVVWAYPIEYNDKDTAGQVRAAPNRFTRLGGTSPLMFLTQGYAVLDNAAMPIVGDPAKMNDTFLQQLVWSAQAAVDAAVDAGVADRERVGVAGHSYGAFMVANLLAHTDLFRAGIARSGAYNRSLTPFGFQSERRTLWEARNTYMSVSPLFTANQIDEPILLIHGEVDNNAGTYPMQSERLFHALEGTGGTSRLVLLPHESHGYSARESVLHVLAESFRWFDEHVKSDRDDRVATKPTAGEH